MPHTRGLLTTKHATRRRTTARALALALRSFPPPPARSLCSFPPPPAAAVRTIAPFASLCSSCVCRQTPASAAASAKHRRASFAAHLMERDATPETTDASSAASSLFPAARRAASRLPRGGGGGSAAQRTTRAASARVTAVDLARLRSSPQRLCAPLRQTPRPAAAAAPPPRHGTQAAPSSSCDEERRGLARQHADAAGHAAGDAAVAGAAAAPLHAVPKRGSIRVEGTQPSVFDQRDLDLMRGLSEQVAVALERESLVRDRIDEGKSLNLPTYSTLPTNLPTVPTYATYATYLLTYTVPSTIPSLGAAHAPTRSCGAQSRRVPSRGASSREQSALAVPAFQR